MGWEQPPREEDRPEETGDDDGMQRHV